MAQQAAPLKEKALKVLGNSQDFLQKTASELPTIHTYEQNLVNILGEEVALAPTGINKSFKQIVEFDDYYKPDGISEEDFVLLKNTMRILFDNTYKKVLDVESGEEDEGSYTLKTFPPCDEQQKELVLQSLIYRKNRLLGQLAQLGVKPYEDIRKNLRRLNEKDKELQGKDTLTARQYLLQYYKLQKFIDNYKTYTLCTSTDDKAFKGVTIDFDDDKIRELLKQYVFFILQGQHPLEDFKKTDPTSSQFVARLAKKPLGSKFPQFMEQYKGKQFPIPEPIAKILESTELAPGAMKAAIDQQILVQTKVIIKYIKDVLPPTHPFFKRFPDLDKVTDLKAILDELVKLLKDCEDYNKDLQEQLNKQKNEYDGKIKTLEQAKKAVEDQKTKLERRVADIEAILSLQQANEAKIVQLNNEKTALEELRDEKERRIGELSGQIATFEQEQIDDGLEIIGLREQVAQLTPLQGQLDALRRTSQTEIDDLRKQLADAIAATDRERVAKEQAIKVGDEARTSLVAKETELNTARTDLQVAEATINTSIGRIAELERQLNEERARSQQQQEAANKASEETQQVRTSLTQGQQRITELDEQITKMNQDLQESTGENEELQQEVEGLQKELAELQTKNTDLEARAKACEENEQRIQSGVNATTEEVNRLNTQLVATKAERDAAKQEAQRLKTEIGSLQVALQDTKEQLEAQKGLVGQRNTQIGQLQTESKKKNIQIDSASKQAELERERAESAERRVQQSEESKIKLEAELKDIYRTSIEQEKNYYDQALRKEREEYAVQIKKAHEDLDKAVVKQAEENKVYRNKKDAELADEVKKRDISLAQKDSELTQVKQERNSALALTKEKQALEQAVFAIASGQTAIPQVGEQETQNALQAILEKLARPVKSTDSLAVAKEQKRDSSMLCYYVFLLSFLWQGNFPSLISNEATSYEDQLKNSIYSKPEEELIYRIFYSIFHQGPDPKTSGHKLGPPNDGLYQILKRDPTLPKFNADIMKEYFSILQLLTRVLMTPEYYKLSTLQLSPIQMKCLEKLIKQIDYLNGIYSEKLNGKESKGWVQNLPENATTATTPTKESIATYTEKFLLARQPKIDKEIFKKRIVIEGGIVKVGTTGNISYPVLFYCFLMLMRDYLNSIENTDKACHLPTFLHIKK